MDSASSNHNPSAAPPPSEVKIRTMRSDMESMAKSGGGFPQFQNVKISGLSIEKESGTVIARSQSKKNLAVIGIVLFAVFVIAAWFVYANFLRGKSFVQFPQAQTAASSSTQVKSPQVAVPTSTPAASNEPPILKLNQNP